MEGSKWGGGRGLFSFYFIKGLTGFADFDRNNLVSLFELDKFLKDSVSFHSDNTQIPLIEGDFKAIVSKINHKLQESDFITGIEQHDPGVGMNKIQNYYAIKGIGDDIFYLLKDSISKLIYLSFKNELEHGRLLKPENACAYNSYNQFLKSSNNRIVADQMRILLIESLQKSFENLLPYIYEDRYAKFGVNEKFSIEGELNTALKLAGNNTNIMSRITAKLLFLQACEITDDLVPGTKSSYNNDKIYAGIELLQKAARLDSMAPHIYLKLGELDYVPFNTINELSWIQNWRTFQDIAKVFKEVDDFKFFINIDIANFYDSINLSLLERKIRHVVPKNKQEVVTLLMHFLHNWNKKLEGYNLM